MVAFAVQYIYAAGIENIASSSIGCTELPIWFFELVEVRSRLANEVLAQETPATGALQLGVARLALLAAATPALQALRFLAWLLIATLSAAALEAQPLFLAAGQAVLAARLSLSQTQRFTGNTKVIAALQHQPQICAAGQAILATKLSRHRARLFATFPCDTLQVHTRAAPAVSTWVARVSLLLRARGPAFVLAAPEAFAAGRAVLVASHSRLSAVNAARLETVHRRGVRLLVAFHFLLGARFLPDAFLYWSLALRPATAAVTPVIAPEPLLLTASLARTAVSSVLLSGAPGFATLMSFFAFLLAWHNAE